MLPETKPPPADAAVPPEREFTTRQHVLFVAVPVLLTALAWVAVLVVAGGRFAELLAAAGAASLFGLGTSVILGPAVLDGTSLLAPVVRSGAQASGHLGTWHLVAMVAWLNTALAFVYTYSLDLFERVPRLGPWLRRAREEARRTEAVRPWIRRWSTLGVGFFVLLPLPGSGALGGSIVGLLTGLSRMRTFLTVSIANALVCVLYGWGGEALRSWFATRRIGLGWRVAGLLGLAVGFALLVRWLRGLTGPRAAAVPGEPRGRD